MSQDINFDWTFVEAGSAISRVIHLVEVRLTFVSGRNRNDGVLVSGSTMSTMRWHLV